VDIASIGCYPTVRVGMLMIRLNYYSQEIRLLYSYYRPHQSELDMLCSELPYSVVCIIDDMQIYVKQSIIYRLYRYRCELQ
jgi:hypothetical protein